MNDLLNKIKRMRIDVKPVSFGEVNISRVRFFIEVKVEDNVYSCNKVCTEEEVRRFPRSLLEGMVDIIAHKLERDLE